jgi:hypothetical protein
MDPSQIILSTSPTPCIISSEMMSPFNCFLYITYNTHNDNQVDRVATSNEKNQTQTPIMTRVLTLSTHDSNSVRFASKINETTYSNSNKGMHKVV